MVSRSRKLKAILLLAIAASAAVFGCIFWLTGRPARPEVYTTQRAGQQRRTWHTMRSRWLREVMVDGSPAQFTQVAFNDSSIYAVAGPSIYRIDKRSGRIEWSKDLTLQGTSYDEGLAWNITVERNRVYATQAPASSGSDPQHTPRICCLNKENGRPIWEYPFTIAVSAPPAFTQNVILAPLVTGEMAGIDKNSGALLWRKQISDTHYATDKSYDCPVLSTEASDNVCIARAGTGHFIGLDPATGQRTWSFAIGGSIRHTEGMADSAVSFAVKDHRIFLCPGQNKLIAYNADTGKRLWRYQADDSVLSDDGVYDPLVVGDLAILRYSGGSVALHVGTGTVAWSRSASDNSDRYGGGYLTFDQSQAMPDTLFEIDCSDIVVKRRQRNLRSAAGAYNIVALDSTTGFERWRSQIVDADYLTELFPSGSTIYCNTYYALMAAEPCPAVELPKSPQGRRQMAYTMIEKLTTWSPTSDSLLGRIRKRFPVLSGSRAGVMPQSDTRADLMLLELGNDSIKPLIDLLNYQVRDADSGKSTTVQTGRNATDTLGPMRHTLDILFDLNAVSTVPELVRFLQGNHSPDMNQMFAELLIRFNDPTAMPALFQYVKSCSGSGPDEAGGEEALNYLCRFAPARATDAAHPVSQDLLTDYMVMSLKQKTAAAWLRRYATFELLHNRGLVGQQLARAEYHSGARARLMPTMQELIDGGDIVQFSRTGTAMPFQPLAKVQSHSSQWWGVFICQYFTTFDFWLAQSVDGKTWTHPTVALRDQYVNGNIRMQHVGGSKRNADVLMLSWIDNENTKKLATVKVADCYRDSDQDGIPDLVEGEIGTHPKLPDSWNSGILDGNNKNPLYHPHKLNQEEQIYQATLEAICQFEEFSCREILNYGEGSDGPYDPKLPLIIPAGPNPAGIPIYGCRGTVLSLGDEPQMSYGMRAVSFRFCPPTIGFDSKLGEDTRSTPGDEAAANDSTFKARFPYIISADGNRVRVGFRSANTSAGFDVEVQKIAGKWTPVECREVFRVTSRYRWVTAAPSRTR